MKRILFSMLTILCWVLFPSCETDGYDADTSLAGSVSMDNYNTDAEITYDGVPMLDPGANICLYRSVN